MFVVRRCGGRDDGAWEGIIVQVVLPRENRPAVEPSIARHSGQASSEINNWKPLVKPQRGQSSPIDESIIHPRYNPAVHPYFARH